MNREPGARRVPLSELKQDDLAAWRLLADAAVEPNPYFDPDFVLPCAAALGADPSLLITEDEQGWTGCLPVVTRRGWRRVPASGLVSWRHLYCFLCVPLLRADAAAAAMHALLSLGIDHGEGSFFGLDHMLEEGPAAVAVESALEALGSTPVVAGRFSRAALRRHPGGIDLAMSRKHRREVNRMQRRLSEELGAEVTLEDRSSDPAAYDEFLHIEQSGWKGAEGTAMASMGHGDLFREICTRFADRGALQLLLLGAGGRWVAGLCNLLARDVGFSFKIAYDESYARYSPGIQLEAEHARLFSENPGLRLVDSCAEPSQRMINRLWPDRRDLSIIAIPASGPRGWVVRPLLQGFAWVRRRRAS